ncbi:MAG: site-specific DNA-methyltransferase [Candidatus Omnitrophota bacterium]|nr:site-specific DNA-methyltransferase [Candidatus Omnitrophota bacterium]
MSTLAVVEKSQDQLKQIGREDAALTDHFRPKLKVNYDLTRALVSFQANKTVAGYRWFKFKEGFSSTLVNYVFDRLRISSGKVIDPFTGSGATLFSASGRGLDALGIELLPVGCEIIRARKAALQHPDRVISTLRNWVGQKPWQTSNGRQVPFQHLRITEGAFPQKTERRLKSYVGALSDVRDTASASVLRLALLSILEEISYTRKDGQYLRWDDRSGRRQGTKLFNKGLIRDFDIAILDKLVHILDDLDSPPDLFGNASRLKLSGQVEVACGSCLEELPKLPTNSFSVLMTSPPYCNRYDYTRTYALELALLGIHEAGIRQLRQQMLSCTVENREKGGLADLVGVQNFERGKQIFNEQVLLSAICHHLDYLRDEHQLNNSGIARMVRNYFWEMTLVILECARVLQPGAPFIMVNDNVRYAGIPIPVDLILSRIAECAGFEVETIWVLPKGKGNSSQQMGEHGREELRKCVYVWRAPTRTQAKQQVPLLGHQR